MRRIGVLIPLGADDPVSQIRLAAFLQGLKELHWTDGSNVQIDYRSGGIDAELMRRDAEELVALTPDVILANGTTAVGPLLQVSRTVPIVFVQVSDPVGAGYVANLARPGGNATGFTVLEYGMSGKWVELLKQTAPGVARAVVLRRPRRPPASRSWLRCTRWRRQSVWSSFRSVRATLKRSNAASPHSCVGAMAA